MLSRESYRRRDPDERLLADPRAVAIDPSYRDAGRSRIDDNSVESGCFDPRSDGAVESTEPVIYLIARRMTGMSNRGTSGVFAREFDQIERAVEVGFAGGRVISVSFPGEIPPDASDEHAILDRIDAYLRGEPDEFTEVAIGLTVPTDRRAVLEALRTVPYGEEVSVSRLARLAALDANDPDDLTLVVQALNDNPIPVLLPDHRVQGGPYTTPEGVRDSLRRIEEL